MTEKTVNERPLVTFALFAYNQERYIREAVEGAFSQTYEPLEIILSDDCSSDRTFEIIQELVNNYKGPHRVVARQSSENKGTLGHILDVSHESQGKYIVVAAGDDISKSTRTTVIVDEMVTSELDVISTASSEFFDDPSHIIAHRCAVSKIDDYLMTGRPQIEQIHGATAAYKSVFLRGLKLPCMKILLEDYVFMIAAYWQEMRVGTLNEALVLHRIHGGNIGPKSRKSDETVMERENKLCAHYRRLQDALNFLTSLQKDLVRQGQWPRSEENPIDPAAIKYAELKSNWPDHSLSARIKFARVSRKFGSPRRDALRILGPVIYSVLITASETLRRISKRSDVKR